jgi:hypothetical protein
MFDQDHCDAVAGCGGTEILLQFRDRDRDRARSRVRVVRLQGLISTDRLDA